MRIVRERCGYTCPLRLFSEKVKKLINSVVKEEKTVLRDDILSGKSLEDSG